MIGDGRSECCFCGDAETTTATAGNNNRKSWKKKKKTRRHGFGGSGGVGGGWGLLLLFFVFDVISASAAGASSSSIPYLYETNPGLLDSLDRTLEQAEQDFFVAASFANTIMTTAENIYKGPVSDNETVKPRRKADPTGVYKVAETHNNSDNNRRSVSKRELPFLMQSEIEIPCPSSSSSASLISGSKAVDYASFAAAIITLVLNINNNINNRNNNNNNFNLNAVDSSNIAANFNTNNANQVNNESKETLETPFLAAFSFPITNSPNIKCTGQHHASRWKEAEAKCFGFRGFGGP